MWTIQTNFYFKIDIVNAFNADVSKWTTQISFYNAKNCICYKIMDTIFKNNTHFVVN
jgi:hypothetical protein